MHSSQFEISQFAFESECWLQESLRILNLKSRFFRILWDSLGFFGIRTENLQESLIWSQESLRIFDLKLRVSENLELGAEILWDSQRFFEILTGIPQESLTWSQESLIWNWESLIFLNLRLRFLNLRLRFLRILWDSWTSGQRIFEMLND